MRQYINWDHVRHVCSKGRGDQVKAYSQHLRAAAERLGIEKATVELSEEESDTSPDVVNANERGIQTSLESLTVDNLEEGEEGLLAECLAYADARLAFLPVPEGAGSYEADEDEDEEAEVPQVKKETKKATKRRGASKAK